MNPQESNKEDLVILECSGVGRYVLHSIRKINSKTSEWNILGFVDDDQMFHGQAFMML